MCHKEQLLSSDQLDFRLYGVIEYISSFIGQNCASQMRKQKWKVDQEESKKKKNKGGKYNHTKSAREAFCVYKELKKKKRKRDSNTLPFRIHRFLCVGSRVYKYVMNMNMLGK